MFAPLVAQARSTGRQAHKAADQTHMARGRMGNQATSRFVAPQAGRTRDASSVQTKGSTAAGQAAPLSWDFSKIPVNPPEHAERAQPPRLLIQAKLEVGSTDDPLEREADRVADRVMRMPDMDVAIARASPQVSRKCATCEVEEQGRAIGPSGSNLPTPVLRLKCATCEEEAKVQRKVADPHASVAEAAPIVDEVLSSPGQPLDAATRAYFEPRFGRDLSAVRVHTGPLAEHANQSLHSHAFTYGSHVGFGRGHNPGAHALLAHELTHVVQQTAPPQISRSAPPGFRAGPHTADERTDHPASIRTEQRRSGVCATEAAGSRDRWQRCPE